MVPKQDDGNRNHNENKSNALSGELFFFTFFSFFFAYTVQYHAVSARRVVGMNPNLAQVSPRPPRPKKNLTSSNPRPKVQNKNLSNQALLHGKGNTASNPNDVDAVYSLFEPAIVKEYVHISLSLTAPFPD